MRNGRTPHKGGPILAPCHVTTYIAGLPAARLTDKAECVGPNDTIVTAAPTTFIGGLPAARVDDQTAHGGIIVTGCLTVWIGNAGMPGASSAGTLQGLTMRAAKQSGKPFCEECALMAVRKAPADDAQRAALRAAKADAVPFCEECARAQA